METISVICFEEPLTGTDPPLFVWAARALEIDLAAQGTLGDTPLEVATNSLTDKLRAKIAEFEGIAINPAPKEYFAMWEEGKPLGKHEITDLGALLEIRTYFK